MVFRSQRAIRRRSIWSTAGFVHRQCVRYRFGVLLGAEHSYEHNILVFHRRFRAQQWIGREAVFYE